jgi:hypothetical protein
LTSDSARQGHFFGGQTFILFIHQLRSFHHLHLPAVFIIAGVENTTAHGA